MLYMNKLYVTYTLTLKFTIKIMVYYKSKLYNIYFKSNIGFKMWDIYHLFFYYVSP